VDRTYRVMGVLFGVVLILTGLSIIDVSAYTAWSRYQGRLVTTEGARAVWIGAVMSTVGLLCLAHSVSATRWFRLALGGAFLSAAVVVLLAWLKTNDVAIAALIVGVTAVVVLVAWFQHDGVRNRELS